MGKSKEISIQGRYKKQVSLCPTTVQLFLISKKSVYNKGIKPSLFFTKPFEQEHLKKLPDELINSFGLDVEDFLAFTLKEDRLR